MFIFTVVVYIYSLNQVKFVEKISLSHKQRMSVQLTKNMNYSSKLYVVKKAHCQDSCIVQSRISSIINKSYQPNDVFQQNIQLLDYQKLRQIGKYLGLIYGTTLVFKKNIKTDIKLKIYIRVAILLAIFIFQMFVLLILQQMRIWQISF